MASMKDQAQKLKNQGNQALLSEQYDRAIELYSKAIQMDPTNAMYYNNISLAYFRKGSYQQALTFANKSLQLDPNLIKAHIKKVQTLIELEMLQEASLALQKGLAISKCEELLTLQENLRKEIEHPIKFDEVPGQKRLIQWLNESKAKFDKLGVAQLGSDYRGVVAKKKIHKKDQILFVPRSHMITLETAKKKCPTCQKLISESCELLSPKHTYLSLYLLQQRADPNSYWKDYIAVLPKEYKSFPIFYENHELNQLQGSGFLLMIKQRVSDLKKDYDQIQRNDLKFNETFLQFCWARTTVCSRIFGIVIDGIKTDAMVPFADMLNHRVPKHTSWNYSQHSDGFVIESVQDIEKGEEVFDSYGKKCNSRFLLNYGFVMANNDANQVVFEKSYKVSFIADDPLFKKKMELINDRSESRYFKAARCFYESGFLEMLGFLRYAHTKDMSPIEAIQVKNKIPCGYYKPNLTPPLGLEIELEVWNYVLSITQKSLNQYPTTLEHDLELLKTNTLSFNVRNCIVQRAGQKQIFIYYHKLSMQMIRILSLPVKQIRRNCKGLMPDTLRFIEEHIIRILPTQ